MFVFHCCKVDEYKKWQELKVYNPEDLHILYTVK